MAWTDEQKATAVQMYKDGEPTPKNSSELIQDIAQTLEQSPNGVRMVLIQAGVYVKKDADTPSSTSTSKSTGEATKRVSKDSQLAVLRSAIENRGATVDEDILSKLTGKAAAYFASILQTNG